MKVMLTILYSAICMLAFPVHAAEYAFEGRYLTYTGEEPTQKTMEALLEDVASVKIQTGKVIVAEGKDAVLSNAVDYRFPVAFSTAGEPTEYNSVKTGLQGKVRLISLEQGAAQLELQIMNTKLGEPNVQSFDDRQLIRPVITTSGLDQASISLPVGHWHFMHTRTEDGKGGEIWAFLFEESKVPVRVSSK